MTTRRLAAILAADVVGFSSLMGEDEEGTLARVKSLRREVIEPKVKEHQGRVFKTTGDGFLIEFQSPVDAVRCAVAGRGSYVQNLPGDLPAAPHRGQLQPYANCGPTTSNPNFSASALAALTSYCPAGGSADPRHGVPAK